VQAHDPDLARIMAVAAVAFSHSGTSTGSAGTAERDRRAATDPPIAPDVRARIESGRTVLYVAEDADGPIASGAHQPVDGVTEVVGVATLPVVRRRGIGAAITAALVEDAVAAGVSTTFLSASSDEVARVYERLGFERVGHAGLAAPAGHDGYG
jgi:GNAT superfamily N-acetyltransferase